MTEPRGRARPGAGTDRERDDLRWPIWLAVAYALLAQRLVVSVDSGGRGLLPMLAVVVPVAALIALAQTRGLAAGFMGRASFLVGWAPYLALALLLPVLGVIVFALPPRNLFAGSDALVAVSFLLLGYAVALRSSGPRAWTAPLLVVILAQSVYAFTQYAYLNSLLPRELLAPLHDWDLSVGAAWGSIVLGRSVGLYVNPNMLGFFGALSAILSLELLGRRSRYVAFAGATLTVLLSQSRGALVALGVALLAMALLRALRGRRVTLKPLVPFLGVLALVVVWAQLGATTAGGGSFSDRLQSLALVLANGTGADPNLEGRAQFWQGVMNLNAIYPWGTLGPPEVILQSAVDNDFFRAFAQGSFVYVAAIATFMVGGLLLRGGHRETRAVRAASVVIVVAALTQTPSLYPAMALYWICLGVSFGRTRATRFVAAAPVRAAGATARAPAR